jgi:hypothetical protein
MNGISERSPSVYAAGLIGLRMISVTTLALGLLVLGSVRASAAPPQAVDAQASRARETTLPFSIAEPRSLSSDSLQSHDSRWSAASTKNVQAGINFGLLQLGLGGFNVATELRYHRLWLEYSHGMDLTLNKLGGLGLTQTERDQDLHIRVPYTTGFGVGITLVDELWLGAEFKAHRYEVNAPGGRGSSYRTASIGPVLGYKRYFWKGLYADAYGRYWPTVATSLDDDKLALAGSAGTVEHSAHDWGVFANISLGYMFRR